MYHAPSKKVQLIQRIAVYTAMSLAVIVLVTILFFFMMGYRFNRDNGGIQQGGLVQFESQPSGASVQINGKQLGTRTSAKATLGAGAHTVTMERAGYHRWQKAITVQAGGVLWLNYARLIPLTLKPSSVADFDTVASSAASPNRKWMALVESADAPVITLANLSQATPELARITLPETSYTAPEKKEDQQFVLQDWDGASRRLIVKHVYEQKTEWLIVDTQRVENTKNITALLGIDAADVAFHPSDTSRLYVKVNNEVRSVDVNAATLSGPLATNVSYFTPYKDMVLYATTQNEETKERTVGYYDAGSRKTHTIRTYTGVARGDIRVAVGKYFETTYIALSHGDAVEVMRGDLPRDDVSEISTLTTVATMTVPGGVSYLSSVNNGRFMVAQSPTAYVTHDLELKKTTRTTLHGATPVQRELRWLDGYTLWSDQGGTLRTYEFDGANQHDIMPVAPGMAVTLSPNGTYVYGISQSEDKTFHLTRVRLILQ